MHSFFWDIFDEEWFVHDKDLRAAHFWEATHRWEATGDMVECEVLEKATAIYTCIYIYYSPNKNAWSYGRLEIARNHRFRFYAIGCHWQPVNCLKRLPRVSQYVLAYQCWTWPACKSGLVQAPFGPTIQSRLHPLARLKWQYLVFFWYAWRVR